MKWAQKQTGFTIVELLIVVVVIAILAAITIVAYNGITQQANFSAYKSDIGALNKAVLMYRSENNTYPAVSSGEAGCWTNQGGNKNFITGLVPKYISAIPSTPNESSGNYYAYCFTSGGAEYKLIRLVSGGQTLPSVELNNNPSLDSIRPNRGWGYWSSGGQAL